MDINIRPFLKELMDNKNLKIIYNEYKNGFDLSVRVNEEKVKELKNEINIIKH